MNVLVGVLQSVIHHHHCDPLAGDVTLPHSGHIDIHSSVDVIMLHRQEGGGGGVTEENRVLNTIYGILI